MDVHIDDHGTDRVRGPTHVTALCAALDAPFVTADQRLNRALRGIGAGSVYLGTLSRA